MKKYQVVVTLLFGLVLPHTCLADDDGPIEADDLFGGGGGYVHPYVTVTSMYDDNVYRTAKDETSDYAMVYSPGIWLALPGTKEQKLQLNTSTLTPGGLGIVEDRGQDFQRFQGYLHYGSVMSRYQDTTDNDTDDQRLDALLQYNLKGGLSFEAMNMYRDGHDERGEGAFGDLDTYTSNLAGGRITYDVGSHFRVRGEYGHFTVAYDDSDNSYLDRADDKYSAYLYYKLSGKSSVFTEYDLTDISYDNMEYLNSTEHTGWLGFRWRHSEKTMGEIKAGYLNKVYSDDAMGGDQGDFVVKGWLDYHLTGKSRLHFTLARLVEEPDANSSQATVTNQGKVGFIHDLTAKITTTAELGYGLTSYEGDYTYHGITDEREDDIYSGSLLVDYQIQQWIGVKARYLYLDRESNFEDLSYTDNRFLLSLTLSM